MAAIHPAQAQIQNGSFEQGDIISDPPGYESLAVGSTDIPNWTTTNAELSRDISGVDGITTPYGSYFLDLTGAHDSSPMAA